ncbi:hypothetical protein GCM10027284_40810 [Cyclobacterium sediminis]
MKNILKSFAVAALMFISLSSMAYVPSVNLINGSTSKSLVLAMVSSTNAQDVSLIDANGNTLFYDDVTDHSYTKSFNLKNLDEGTYFINVNNKEQSVVYTLVLEADGINILNKEMVEKPSVFDTYGHKVNLNLNNSDRTKVAIEVTNQDHAKLYKEVFTGKKTIDMTFNFERAVQGDYTISVKDGNEVYTQEINVN